LVLYMTRPSSRKNRITFGSDPDTDMDFVSFIYFPHRCRIGHFMTITSISHTVTGCFSPNSVKVLMPTREWIHYILGAIWRTSGSEYRSVLKSGFKSWITFCWGKQSSRGQVQV